jgi:hypothetical protein
MTKLNLEEGKRYTVYDEKRGDCLYIEREVVTTSVGVWDRIHLNMADIEIIIDDVDGVVLRKGDILKTDG